MANNPDESKWTVLRRACSAAALIVLLFVLGQSTAGREFQVCTDQVHERTGATIEVCRPIQPTDAVFLVAFLLALMPLLPDLQRLQVGNLISLERRLKATEASQDALRAQLQAIVRQDVHQEQHLHMPEPSATSHINVFVSGEELQRKQREFFGQEEVDDGE